ncbi:MAG TPA: UDP-N-acetylmuramoyl-tripeptide--D-alanyl-D-alanine ligase [Acidobacteriota bacterium]|nr:UDP-N-acetylmuramoyl-tripeptide--D-alanyl-D-alanine ligase [Acidobacteriota bacterium]HNT17343.1 UDP-N-acetylmuramoyl-tripeptide--D-alanyl-D-alanine ligase [Acidobacteriota bacterium]
MRIFSASEAAKTTGAELLGDPGTAFSGVSYDSRSVLEGSLFVAVKGEKADGADYIEASFARGASVALTSRRVEPPPGRALLLAESPEEAVRLLAISARRDFKGTVISVVGSAGKTTTKEFSAKFLSTLGRTFATSGNRNNLLGLPEMILGADETASYWVLEMGISKPGEMESLAPIASPNVVLFTSIRPVHTEFFPSLESIRDEKAKVLCHLSRPSFFVYNADDALLCELPALFGTTSYSFGRSEKADLRILSIEDKGENGFSLELLYRGESVTVPIPFLNMVQCHNFSAALMLTLALGGDLSSALEVAPLLSPAAHRGVPHCLKQGILLYDDSYNSNPEALVSLIKSASGWKRRLVGVFGEMKELGAESEKYHREAGALASEVFSSLLCVGADGARTLALEFSGSDRQVFWAGSWEDGYRWLRGQVDPGDAVIVKGSRSIGLDKLVDRFLEDYKEGAS